MVCWIIVLVDLSTGNNLGITSFLSIYFPWKWRSSKNGTLRWFQADFRTMFKNSSRWLLQHEPHSFTPLYIFDCPDKKTVTTRQSHVLNSIHEQADGKFYTPAGSFRCAWSPYSKKRILPPHDISCRVCRSCRVIL